MNFSFLNGQPSLIDTSSIGLPHSYNNYKLSDGSIANVQIMDTAGQERFKSLNTSYYRKADCCLLVYDITNINSFEECTNYFNEKIKENCKENIPIILIGNKTDLENERKVSSELAQNFALENNYIFMETSCLKNENVADAFETLIEITHRELLNNKTEKGPENENIKITKETPKDSYNYCYC